jgi:hypothetical protein
MAAELDVLFDLPRSACRTSTFLTLSALAGPGRAPHLLRRCCPKCCPSFPFDRLVASPVILGFGGRILGNSPTSSHRWVHYYESDVRPERSEDFLQR